ncbi:MAG TPA: glycosyltransferase family 87 protein [Stellaceae bacterium]
MGQFSRQQLVALGVVCAAAGVYGWAVFLSTFHHDGTIAPHYNAPGTDWMVFYAAARAFFDGNLALIFDGVRFTAHQNEIFAPMLSAKLPYHPWLYPPHFLLLALPFGLLPFSASYALFMLVTGAILVATLWLYAAPEQRWLHIASVLLCPAASMTVIAGQNAFLTAALLIGGFGLLPRRPLLAGAFLGIATFKPTLWLMVPVALVAARQWRALAAAAAMAGALALASLMVFGVEMWRQWLEMALSPPADFYSKWLESGRSWGLSVYTCAWVLGAPHRLATLIQAAATLAAAASVYVAFRGTLAADRKLAVLLAAAILAGPHVSSYDTLLLAIAATILFCRALQEGAPLYQITAMLAVWLVPLFNPPRATPVGLMTPLFIAALLAVAMTGLRRPAPQGAAAAA